MPNWVANSVHCDDLEVLGKLRDFNRIVLQPLLLDKTESGSNSSHYDKLVAAGLTHQDIIQPENAPSRFVRYGQDDYGNAIHISRPMPLAEWLPHARRYYLCRRLYGHSTWYDWRPWLTGEPNGTAAHTAWKTTSVAPLRPRGHIRSHCLRRCHGNIRSWHLKYAMRTKTWAGTPDATPSKTG